MVSDVEPIFAATPVLRGALADDVEEGERNTLLSRRFPGGGSLKIVAARAPRNLRRHTARILIVDEADACESGPEGNPIRLAEHRTFTFGNRKIIIGSTPIFTDTSHVLRAYGESDQRVYECPVSFLRRVYRNPVGAHRLAGGRSEPCCVCLPALQRDDRRAATRQRW